MRSLKNHLLIASPSLVDGFFQRTVILMLDHGEEGAAGIVLNRKTEASLSDVAETIFNEPFDWDKPLNLGGPVPGPLMVIHKEEGLADQEILDGVFNTIESTKVREVLLGRPDPCLLIANYSGWGPGQLENEFGVDSWLTLPATPDHVFWDDPRELWDVVVKEVNARKLSDFLGLREIPSDPSLN